MTIPMFFSEQLARNTGCHTAIEFLILNSLCRDPAEVEIDLLVHYPHEAISCCFEAKDLMESTPNTDAHYVMQQLEALHKTTYQFIHRMLNRTQKYDNVSPSFYGNTNVITQERQAYLSLFRANGASSESCLNLIKDFDFKRGDHFINLCFLSLLIGVKVTDTLFGQLFEELPKSVLYNFYSLLLLESQKDKVNLSYQARFSLYVDHFAKRLRMIELELVQQTVVSTNTSDSELDVKTSSDIPLGTKQIDVASLAIPTAPDAQDEHQSYEMVNKPETGPVKETLPISIQVSGMCTVSSIPDVSGGTTIISSAQDVLETKDDVFMSFEHLKMLSKGSRIDVMDSEGNWCNAEVKESCDDTIKIHFIFWQNRWDISISQNHTFFKKVAFPGTMANDHLRMLRLPTLVMLFPNVIPNIIHCDPEVSRVYDGSLRSGVEVKNGLRWMLSRSTDIENCNLLEFLHRQIDIFSDGKILFHGCIERVKFQGDSYFYALGFNSSSKQKYFLPLSKNDERLQLPLYFELKCPEDIVLWTHNHE